MANRTCTVRGCVRPLYAKGLCSACYMRARYVPRQRTCDCLGCGAQIPAGRKYCGPECRPQCVAPECDRPSRKRGWCDRHYSRWLKNGSALDEDQAWTVGERGECVVCTAPVPQESPFRKYCGWACSAAAFRGPRPQSAECVLCGITFSLIERDDRGRLPLSHRRVCLSCGPRTDTNLRRHHPVLIERDGTGCSLCGNPIDFTLAHPDPMSASVDHVVPRSHGGADDVSNYALAHWICNVRKGPRGPQEPPARTKF